ncbi:hypothetical protein VN12_18795 [Pirellula sp. SH-Sr6A]|nr:hypothetical protein VN12_18795 [Pirellula sp. SH-Sr6A]
MESIGGVESVVAIRLERRRPARQSGSFWSSHHVDIDVFVDNARQRSEDLAFLQPIFSEI